MSQRKPEGFHGDQAPLCQIAAPVLPLGSYTARGHDLTLLQELQELTPAQRITRNCEMADWIEKLQAATDSATRSDLPKPG